MGMWPQASIGVLFAWEAKLQPMVDVIEPTTEIDIKLEPSTISVFNQEDIMQGIGSTLLKEAKWVNVVGN